MTKQAVRTPIAIITSIPIITAVIQDMLADAMQEKDREERK